MDCNSPSPYSSSPCSSSPCSSSPCGTSTPVESVVDSFLRLLREAVGKENSREEIISIVKDLKFRIHDWEKFVHFSDSRYVRSLVATEQEFSVLLLCWAPGQSNAVHKHTQSSGDLPVTSYSRVLCGKLTLSLYAESDLANPMQVLPLTPADISFESSCHPLGYHRISNDSPCPAISIHIYSPPYISCLYPQSEDRTNFVPPVFHPSGGGAAEEQRSPNPNSAAHINSALVNPLFGSLNDLIDILRSAIELTPDGRAHSSTNVEHVKRILTNFSLDPQEWHSYVSKSKQKYTRNIIAFEPKFTILLLVWDKNQFSPIHDHASSNCWVKLLSGLLQEVRYSATGYDLAQGEAADATRVTPLSSNVYSPGAVTYINDQQGLHKMGNPSGSAITCSLHIYSPPYRECNIFKSLTPMPAISPCGSAVEPAEAEGASTTGQVRAYECNKEKVCISAIYGKEHTFMLHPAQQAPDEAPKTQLDCSGNACQSSSLEVLQDLLRRAFAEHPREKVSPVIHDILKGIQFCAAEWRQYVHFNPQRYSRNLLLFDEHFSLLLNCWAPGQGTPVHDHGSENRVSWVRVLGGALRFTEFDDEGQVQREITYLERSSNDSFVDTSALPHKLENVSEQDTAISIHLYSPPFLHCRYIDTEGSHRLIPAAFCSSAVAPSACSPRLSIERLRFALETQEAVFTNLRSFCQVVSDLLFSAFFGKSVQEGTILRAAGATNAVILKALRTVQFNPKEWNQYISRSKNQRCPSYSLIAACDVFTMYLGTWPSQAVSSPDAQPSVRWMRVLQGSLQETQFEPIDGIDSSESAIVETQTTTLLAESVSSRVPKITNSFKNTHRKATYTLHIFSPAYFFPSFVSISETQYLPTSTNLTSENN